MFVSICNYVRHFKSFDITTTTTPSLQYHHHHHYNVTTTTTPSLHVTTTTTTHSCAISYDVSALLMALVLYLSLKKSMVIFGATRTKFVQGTLIVKLCSSSDWLSCVPHLIGYDLHYLYLFQGDVVAKTEKKSSFLKLLRRKKET